MINFVLVAVTLVFAVLRFFITPRLDVPTVEGSYEAFAHLFVGGLFGAWLSGTRKARLCFWLAVSVSLLELVMFLIQKANR